MCIWRLKLNQYVVINSSKWFLFCVSFSSSILFFKNLWNNMVELQNICILVTKQKSYQRNRKKNYNMVATRQSHRKQGNKGAKIWKQIILRQLTTIAMKHGCCSGDSTSSEDLDDDDCDRVFLASSSGIIRTRLQWWISPLFLLILWHIIGVFLEIFFSANPSSVAPHRTP